MIAHNVFFKLHDGSEVGRAKLLDACRMYLTGHPGVVSFAVGIIEPDLARPVNDRDFDVALHMIFDSRESHDVYQDQAPRHAQFIEENKADWAQVRVFDSIVEMA